ncbi:MAG: hypothetical protein QOG96_1866 [Pseudonocardiales bacterium]|jgi:hypothetical protein|nr:hypothetical protein [Pseudonocardiales bacterium]
MSVGITVGLVLLPAAMYGLALLLATCRDWLGVTGVPRARNVARLISSTRGRGLGESGQPGL